MGRLRAILADLDGTLADTQSMNAIAYAKALCECGYSIPEDTVAARISGRRYDAFLPELTGVDDPAIIKKIALTKRVIYTELIADVRLNLPLLNWLEHSAMEFRLALVTTASRQAVDAFLARDDWLVDFSVIVTGDDVQRGKPDPEAYELAARQLGVGPDQCLVLEDSATGLEAARRFGAQVLMVNGFPGWAGEPL